MPSTFFASDTLPGYGREWQTFASILIQRQEIGAKLCFLCGKPADMARRGEEIVEILKKVLIYYLSFVSLFFIGRLALFLIYFERIGNSGVNYWLSFIYGLRMDTIIASILLVVPVILLTLTPRLLKTSAEKILKIYLLISGTIVIFIENATFPFFAQYDCRPNYLFVEYLVYPKEVFGMIMEAYKIELAICFALISLFVFLFLKRVKIDFSKIYESGYVKRSLIFIPLAMILFLGIRSSFGHRPANMADAMYSSNRIVNEITKNSIHSIIYAAYSNKYEVNAAALYGGMDIDEALLRLQRRLNIQSVDKQSPLSREVKTHFQTDKPKNLVIFIQESLGSQFLESLGGEKGITPNLDRLSQEGVFFKNAFSNGTRSIRGIAGCVSGNFSIPGKGVVKRSKSQSEFFTLSSLLEPIGYHTLFLYGGESRFDNMRGWFLGNGFDEIIDEPEFENPSFVGTWGVSDGDLVNRANEEFRDLYKNNQKFAAVMFSTSNHTPFDFPDGKIDLIEGVPEKSVKNAIKYADFAIGDFINKARSEDYYRDTVFVIIADHNVRVYGDDVVPVNMFHIPALIPGGGIEPYAYEKLSTQPDVLATALDLMGLDLKYPIMGNSIFGKEKQEVALMQFNDFYALRVKDKVAVIRPDKMSLTFVYEKEHLKQAAKDKELETDALAFVLALDHLYDKKLYR
jgi:phosphoglycerol transferase MdoB-like AlkP superfamily enzyme